MDPRGETSVRIVLVLFSCSPGSGVLENSERTLSHREVFPSGGTAWGDDRRLSVLRHDGKRLSG